MESLRISRLTDRQRTCLRLVHAHLSSKEIATQVGIGPGTVDQHIKAAMLILGVCDRREAARMLVNHEAATAERPLEAQPEAALGAATPATNIVRDVLASVQHGLGNILNFSGRDSREQFRLYAIFLFATGAATAFSVVNTRLVLTFMQLRKFAMAHPEQFRDFTQLKREHPQLMPNFADLPLILGLITVLHLALIAAAVARRRHDWTRLEVWGWLPLPILNIAFMAKPAIAMLVLLVATTIIVFVYALIRGGAPERITAIVFGIGGFLFSFAFAASPADFSGGNFNALVADSAMLLVFILFALRANRFWPIWMVAHYCLGVLSHLILLTNPRVDPAAYGLVVTISALLTLLILAVGTRNHQLRLRQNGVDPAWVPFARSGRIEKRHRNRPGAGCDHDRENERDSGERQASPETALGC